MKVCVPEFVFKLKSSSVIVEVKLCVYTCVRETERESGRERGDKEREWLEDAMLLALEIEYGATNQGILGTMEKARKWILL